MRMTEELEKKGCGNVKCPGCGRLVAEHPTAKYETVDGLLWWCDVTKRWYELKR